MASKKTKKKRSSKEPGYYMYAMDWMRDLLPHPLEIRGFWTTVMNIVCFSKSKGSSTMTLKQWAGALSIAINKCLECFVYVKSENIGDISDFSGDENQRITVSSRRMVNDAKLSTIRSKSANRRWNPKDPDNVQDKGQEVEEKEFSDHKKFMDFYFESFKEKFGVEPIIQGGKDGETIKRLLSKIELEELKVLLIRFFKSEDKFIRESGYTLGVFQSVIQKLRIGSKKSIGQTFEAGELWQGIKDKEDEKKRQNSVQTSDGKS